MNARSTFLSRTMRSARPAWLLGLAFVASLACAQSPSPNAAPQAFEVASIRRVNTVHTVEELMRGIGTYSISTFPTNRLTVRNTSLSNLICLAYGVDTDQISGGPDWITSQYYDLIAKADGVTALSLEQMRPLLQHLLEDRFHLRVHRSSKTVPGYALIATSSGPKLKPSAASGAPRAQMLPNAIQAWSADTATLAAMLARPAGRPVVDKTGLQGTYDFKLEYARPEDTQSSLPSVFIALEEQLGLKLSATKVDQELLVVDSADRNPAEN